MQNLFAPGGPWATPWMEEALSSIKRLAAHAPERIVFTRFIPPANASEANGMWRAYYRKWSAVTRDGLNPDLMELVPELRGFVPPARVIDRMVYSAFGGGRLLGFLTKHHVDTLIISGGETDVCVLSTVLSAVDLGYRVILVEGALCGSSDDKVSAQTSFPKAARCDYQMDRRPLSLIAAASRSPSMTPGILISMMTSWKSSVFSSAPIAASASNVATTL